jgi:Flp pilus assembly protein TadD
MRENASALAQRGQWLDAAAKYSRLVSLQRNDPELCHGLAALLLQTSDLRGYERHCAAILERFGSTPDRMVAARLGRDCLILPCSGTNLDGAIQLIEKAGAADSQNSGDYLLARALAELRRGNFSEAIARLGRIPAESGLPEQDAQAALILSLANGRLGQMEQARSALEKAKEIIEAGLPKIENGFLGERWVEWIVTYALLREVRLLVETR